MGDYDHGPLRTYEITWRAREPEIVQGHQVLFESMGFSSYSRENPRFMIHGEFDGHWRLVLTGQESEVIAIRDVTDHMAALEALASDDDGSI